MPPESTKLKIMDVLYRAVLPISVIILLLGVASFNHRPELFLATGSDLFIRFLLCLWFCGLYLRLSRFSSYSMYSNRKWTKDDVGPAEKYFYWGLIVFFGIGCGILTWWTVQSFLPNLANLAWIIAFINLILIIVPMLKHYWVIKL